MSGKVKWTEDKIAEHFRSCQYRKTSTCPTCKNLQTILSKRGFTFSGVMESMGFPFRPARERWTDEKAKAHLTGCKSRNSGKCRVCRNIALSPFGKKRGGFMAIKHALGLGGPPRDRLSVREKVRDFLIKMITEDGEPPNPFKYADTYYVRLCGAAFGTDADRARMGYIELSRELYFHEAVGVRAEWHRWIGEIGYDGVWEVVRQVIKAFAAESDYHKKVYRECWRCGR